MKLGQIVLAFFKEEYHMSTKASSQKLNEAIQNSPVQNQQGTGVDPYRKAQSYLKAMLPAITEALPKNGVNADRLCRLTLTTLRQNPKLLECSIESLLACVLQAAQLGLEPNLLGSCFFVPFKNTCSFQIGYKGLIDLACRSGEVQTIVAQEVRKGDTFHYEFGRNETLKHIPAPNNERGEIEYFYAYANLRNGGFTFQVMHISEIEKVRNEHSVSYKYDKTGSIWVKHFEPMAAKTVIKKLIKYLPISVDIQNAIAHDETIRRDITSEAIHVDRSELNDNVQEYKVEIIDKQEENAV
jgi:recombination protein RecT